MLSKKQSNSFGTHNRDISTPNLPGKNDNNNTILPKVRKDFFATADEIMQLTSDLKAQKQQKNIAKERDFKILDKDLETKITSSENEISEILQAVRERYVNLLTIMEKLMKYEGKFAIDKMIQSKIDEIRTELNKLIDNDSC